MIRFADTYFYLALLSPRDNTHAKAKSLSGTLRGGIVTTEFVLLELGDGLARPRTRQTFLRLCESLTLDAEVDVVPASTELLKLGLDLYASRPDKEWSLTDCISFVVMRSRGIREALTGDHHFEQAGFIALLK